MIEHTCAAFHDGQPTSSYGDWVDGKASRWVSEHPADAVRQLIADGVLKDTGYDLAGLTGDPYPTYKVVLPTGDETDG